MVPRCGIRIKISASKYDVGTCCRNAPVYLAQLAALASGLAQNLRFLCSKQSSKLVPRQVPTSRGAGQKYVPSAIGIGTSKKIHNWSSLHNEC